MRRAAETQSSEPRTDQSTQSPPYDCAGRSPKSAMADPAAVPLDGNRGLGDRDAESVPNSWRKSRRTSEPSSSKRGPSTSLDSNGASLRMSRNTARSEAGGSGVPKQAPAIPYRSAAKLVHR